MTKPALVITCLVMAVLTGCSAAKSLAKNVFEISSTPEELAAMSAADVCIELGYEQYRTRPQSYLNAKNEASRRITLGQLSADDCNVFAQMGVRKASSRAQGANQAMENSRVQHTNCVNTYSGVSCTTN